MNILIAHPNAANVQAMKQMLLSNDRDYYVGSSLTLSELVEQVSFKQYDLVLVDSELANNNKSTFFKVLSTIKHESRIVLSVKKDEIQIRDIAKEYGINDLIEKKKGYLVTLNNFVKNTDSRKPVSSQTVNKKISNKAKDDFFVCDKHGRFLAINKQLERLLKYSREELFEFTIIDLLADMDEVTFIRNIISHTPNPRQEHHLVLLDKAGKRQHVYVRFRLLYEGADQSRFIGFRGIKSRNQTSSALTKKHKIDQRVMTKELVDLVQTSYSEPLNIFLQRISEVVCQIFKFKRSTIALLDHRKQSYIKQVMVGFSGSGAGHQKHTTVPREAVDRLFQNNNRIKTVYYQKALPASRSNTEQVQKPWHSRDMVLMRLSDSNNITYGYISLDSPKEGLVPTEATFHNMELFSQFISMSIENYYRFNALERKNRRLRQLFASNNVFKLQSSLDDLLNETVWSSKHILDFRLVTLALISKKTQMLETRAVACDDRIKQVQLRDLYFDLDQFSDILKDKYVIGKSFIVNRQEAILHHFKKIYYGADANSGFEGEWPNWALLLVPIKSQEGKIIGFFMADDPVDNRMPTTETIQLLEILASQIAIAIDNRVMYVQARSNPQQRRYSSAVSGHSAASFPPVQDKNNDR